MRRLAVLLAAGVPALAHAGLRDRPGLPHPAAIPTVDREVGIPLQIPVPELDRRPPPETPAGSDSAAQTRVFVVDLGGADDDDAQADASAAALAPARRASPSAAQIERAVAARDPQALVRLFDGDGRAAVGALARLAAAAPLEPGRVESLLRVAEPLSVERIRDARGRTPPPGEKQQLFNTSVHDALAARPLTDALASSVAASLERLASRAINDPGDLTQKLLSRFRAQRAEAAR